MLTLKKIGGWIVAAAVAIVGLLALVFAGRRQAEEEGAAHGKADADRARLDEAAAKGDDAVLDEFREHNRRKP